MDDTDQKLQAMLASNPRIHLQDLAERLGISKQAVHHRMRALKETGVIQGTTAGISFAFLNAIPVAVFGTSKAAFIEDALRRLGESDFTRRVVVAGGNYIYVVGVLRRLPELDGYVEFVRRAAEMRDPIVGVYSLDEVPMPDYHVDGIQLRKRNYRKLTPLDLKVIASLKEDARRPVSDIAGIAGVTTKVAKRCLDNMISEGSIELHVLMDTPIGGETLSLMHINLKDGSGKGNVAERLLSKLKPSEGYIRAFSNLPNFLIVAFWAKDLRELRRVFREACEGGDIVSVTLNIAYLERVYYTTWRDKLLDTPAVTSEQVENVKVP